MPLPKGQLMEVGVLKACGQWSSRVQAGWWPLPTLYGVRLDHASDRTRSTGLQNWRDRLVKLALIMSRKSRRPVSGELSATGICRNVEHEH